MSTTYPKINTIWKRDEKNKGKIIEGDFAREEFKSINRWQVSEKIDGTNIRVIYLNFRPRGPPSVTFQGKTDNAQISAKLVNKLREIFTVEKFQAAFPKKEDGSEATDVILYGEGYGGTIQGVKGGDAYGVPEGIILFDANVDGWWLEREAVFDIASKMGVPCVPAIPSNGLYVTTDEAIAFVKNKTESQIWKGHVIEGIVCRAYPMMMFKNPPGEPIMWKLKVKDYKE